MQTLLSATETTEVGDVPPVDESTESRDEQQNKAIVETPTVVGVYPGDTLKITSALATLRYEDDKEVPIIYPPTKSTSGPNRRSTGGALQPGKAQPRAKTAPAIKPNKVAPSSRGLAKSRDASKVRSNKIVPETSERANDVKSLNSKSTGSPSEEVPCDYDTNNEPPAVFMITSDGITNPGYIASPEEDPTSGERGNEDATNESNV